MCFVFPDCTILVALRNYHLRSFRKYFPCSDYLARPYASTSSRHTHSLTCSRVYAYCVFCFKFPRFELKITSSPSAVEVFCLFPFLSPFLSPFSLSHSCSVSVHAILKLFLINTYNKRHASALLSDKQNGQQNDIESNKAVNKRDRLWPKK